MQISIVNFKYGFPLLVLNGFLLLILNTDWQVLIFRNTIAIVIEN